MIEKTGDLFDTDAFWIGHGVNTQGVMGAGIAKTFRDKYPINYLAYRRDCAAEKLKAGGILSIYEHQRVVVNLATQILPGRQARYRHVLMSTSLAAANIMNSGSFWNKKPKVLAIPELGCGIGGLRWPVVRELLLCVEEENPGFQFEVWHYDGGN